MCETEDIQSYRPPWTSQATLHHAYPHITLVQWSRKVTVTAAESGPRSFEQEGEEPELAEDLCKYGDTAHKAFFFPRSCERL